jgi:hypothetical protein
MTASPTLIGLGAGLVAAVLFASLANNSALAILLFFLTPLPILLAGIGWGRPAALIAFLTSTALLGAVLSWHLVMIFGLFVGLPGFILSYLMLLHRVVPQSDVDANASAQVEWYPLGWVVAWASVIAGGLIGLGIVLLSGDADTYRKVMRAVFQEPAFRQFQEWAGAPAGPADMERVADRFAFYGLPFLGAASWLLVIVGNLWLAIRSAAISGLLIRPVPDFSRMNYPPFLLPAFLVALLLSLTSGLPGVAGMAFLGAFTYAWVLLGISVLYVLLAGSQLKTLVLTFAYVGLMVLPWLLVPPLTLLGIAEVFLNLRQRFWRSTTPPGNGLGPTH